MKEVRQMNEMKICDYALVDLLMYAPASLPYDCESAVTKDGSVKLKSNLNNVTFTFEGDGIICIADKSGQCPMKFDTHAWYCRNVAAKDMLQHLVNRYVELTEHYNRLNEAVDRMLANLDTERFNVTVDELLKDKPSE